jgi:hypothetical protein
MIQDAIFFRGIMYAVCAFDSICTILLGANPTAKQAGPLSGPLIKVGAKYLVDFLGELLLVQRYVRKTADRHYVTTSFVVHKVNLEEKIYSRCTDFGDYAIFLGVSSPMVVDSNLIVYFTDYYLKLSAKEYGNDDTGVYNMKKGMIEPYHSPEFFHTYDKPPIWLTPNCTKL